MAPSLSRASGRVTRAVSRDPFYPMTLQSMSNAGYGFVILLASTGCAATAASGGASASGDADLGVVDVRPGTGALAVAHQCLYVHYIGVLADGRTFDSTRDSLPNGRAQPPVGFELGAGRVMPGWERGLVGMQVGGQRRLFVPYRLAYGARGQPPAIPPKTDLVFDIELLAAAPTVPTASNAPRAETAPTCAAWSSISRSRCSTATDDRS